MIRVGCSPADESTRKTVSVILCDRPTRGSIVDQSVSHKPAVQPSSWPIWHRVDWAKLGDY